MVPDPMVPDPRGGEWLLGVKFEGGPYLVNDILIKMMWLGTGETISPIRPNYFFV